MAKSKKTKSSEKPISARMLKHLEALGMRSPEAYFDWCRDRGFDATIEKGQQQRRAELDAFRSDQDRVKSQTRIHSNPRKLIEQACAGEIRPDDITRPYWHEFCRSIYGSKADKASREALRGLLLKVHNEADFLLESVTFGPHTYRYVDALVRLNDRRGQWVRPLEDWRPDTHNGHRQFSSLARHLMARYPVPRFMDSAWFRTDRGSHRLRDWFIHIGSGRNIRTAKTPVPLTKRMAHHFVQAPHHYSIENAIRWGQIHALGGDSRLTEAVLGTPVGESFAHDDFWSTVFKFFVANPMLDRKHVGPIMDFLRYQKFESREVLTGPGTVEVQEPPQPNLSMRGRTPESLLGQVDAWHRDLGRARVAEGLYFRRSGVKEFEQTSGRGENKATWRIRELLSGAELVAEGRAMRHCVATYASSCASGRCSIWAMELHTPQGIEKHQTVEVSRDGIIVECRGKQNRLPEPGEFEVLKRWAREAGLTISHYVGAEY